MKAARHVKVVAAERLTRYFAKNRDMLDFIAVVHGLTPPERRFEGEFVAFHAFEPGFLDLDAREADQVRALARGEADAAGARVAPRLRERGWLDDVPPDVDALVRRTLTDFPAIQNPVELRAFLREVEGRRPETVVEIGSAAGGTLFCLAQLAAPDALLVSIDAPEMADAPEEDAWMVNLLASFAGPAQRVACIRDRSFHHSTVVDLERELAGRRVDLLFIDGDHSYGGVRSDYEMYRRFVAPSGIVAFHDICMLPETWGRGNDVGIFWRELASRTGAREIIDRDGSRTAPRFDTPVGFVMPALGFGLLPVEPA